MVRENSIWSNKRNYEEFREIHKKADKGLYGINLHRLKNDDIEIKDERIDENLSVGEDLISRMLEIHNNPEKCSNVELKVMRKLDYDEDDFERVENSIYCNLELAEEIFEDILSNTRKYKHSLR